MTINIIVPCYNEQEVLPWAVEHLQQVVAQIDSELHIATRLLFVDDGSRDNTWQLIEQTAKKYDNVEGLKLAHNVGHQNALWAGMN